MFGDSVSCGEVSEAVEYVGKEDPKHDGEYSNSWYSYSWMTARKLGAELHDTSQGGIALLDGTGWFLAPDYLGVESCYDKIEYNTAFGTVKQWDFRKYQPQVVIVAIGQNDNHPTDEMAIDYHSEKSKHWRKRYQDFIEKLMQLYPKSQVILTTTILCHDKSWDEAIEEVCEKINNPRVHHFLYKRNGCGTPGHIRIPEAGEKLTIGFFGGSITMGSLSSTPKTCYAYHVYEWWCKTFPQAEFTYVNAGIGATDSQFGCARVESDLLQYQPDFVVVDFSVNDESNEHYFETYEGVIRKLYFSKTKPAVLLLHNVYYNNGANAQLWHAKVARQYGIPAVSMQSSIYTELLAGRIENRAITPDDLHPNDAGHELVASVITYALEQMKAALKNGVADPMIEAEKIAPITQNAYEDSVRYQNNSNVFVSDGFLMDEEKQEVITDIFKNGWTAAKKGERITFEVEGSCIGVQYRKTIQKPAPVAELVLDGDREHAVLLDANFEETWGDKLQLDTVLDHGEAKLHKVEITIKETHEGDKLPFYLVSVIASGK